MGTAEDVVEKDYVLGWVLWGIGSDPVLGNGWVFKGGTCLKKCYVETYRFSEDLDFTVLPGAPGAEAEVAAALGPMLARIQEASGIDFGVRELRIRVRPGSASMEGRLCCGDFPLWLGALGAAVQPLAAAPDGEGR